MKIRLIVGVLTLIALVSWACGGDDADDATTFAVTTGAQTESRSQPAVTAAATAAAAVPQADTEGTGSRAVASAGGADGQAAGPALVAPRDVIYTASVLVTVEDVVLATEQAVQAISGLGGLVFGQETTLGDQPRTFLTFKVDPQSFNEALGRLSALGELESQNVSADDVTDLLVDLESRIITSEVSVLRLRGFLEGAESVEALAALERELLDRETQLERLRGQLRTTRNQVSLATIWLTLQVPTPPAQVGILDFEQTAYVDSDAGRRCPGDDRVTADEGDPLTVCLTLVNAGTLTLSEIRFSDYGLDVDERDFILLEGSLERLLPGERTIGYFSLEATVNRYPELSLSAVPLDDRDQPLRDRLTIEGRRLDLVVREDDSLPGVLEALTESLRALRFTAHLTALSLAVALPWVVVLLVAVVLLIALGRRLPGGWGRFASASRPASRVAATTEEPPAGDSEPGRDGREQAPDEEDERA